MTTEEAIIRFKNGCALPFSKFTRKHSYLYQNQRNIWEVSEPLGLIRIYSDGNKSHIIAFNNISYREKRSNGKPFKSEIPNSVYKELEYLYKGEFETTK